LIKLAVQLAYKCKITLKDIFNSNIIINLLFFCSFKKKYYFFVEVLF